MKLKKSVGVIFVLVGSIGGACAQSLGTAGAFNVFVFGNAQTAGGHTHGAAAVGGSWTGSQDVLQHNYPVTLGALSPVGMYVGGAVSFSGGSVNNAGNAYIGGAFTGSLNMNGGTRFANSGLVDPTLFTQQKAYSTSQSNAIAGLSGATGIAGLISDPNNLNINVAGLAALSGSPTTKLLRMDASLLSTFSSLQVNFNNMGNDTVIIDVTGSAIDWKWKMNSSAFNHVLWNFAGANSLRVGTDQFRGSILAPNADLLQERDIEGNVIVNNWQLNGSVENHFGNQFQFNGNAVPEPATMAVMATGALALLRRRKRA